MKALFLVLNHANKAAHNEWGAHVDHCKDCARSPFACAEGQRLHERSNAAWCAAKREYDRLKAAGLDPAAPEARR